MKYEVCPICGSTLDFGEKCDCEKGKGSEPPHANESGPLPKAAYNNKPFLHYSTKKVFRQGKNNKNI